MNKKLLFGTLFLLVFATSALQSASACLSKRACTCSAIVVGEEIEWKVTITVTNPYGQPISDVVVSDRFGAEIEIDDYEEPEGTTLITWTKGKSNKVFLRWEIGDLDAYEEVKLILWVSTDLNPAEHQEYTEPGCYELNSGAVLKFIDPWDHQFSEEADPIYIWVE